MISKVISRFLFASAKTPNFPSYVHLTTDVYRSFHLRLSKKLSSPDEFRQSLHHLVSSKQSQNKLKNIEEQTNAIWVHLSKDNFDLLSPLCQQMQFKIHHGLKDQLTLYKWISSMSDLATPYSLFYVSCGAIIIKNEQIYLVQEKSGPRKGQYGVPGGRADMGQCLPSCVERQLFEETGIKAKYDYVLHLRQLTNTAFGGLDHYFACMMKHDENSFKEMKLCSRQLSDGKWVNLSEYRDFAIANSYGTQQHLGKYIYQLYSKGYDFSQKANELQEREYISPKDKIPRKVLEYKLIKD